MNMPSAGNSGNALTVNPNHAVAAFMEMLHGCPPHATSGASDQDGFL
jgi:hypothetical protein